VSQALDEPTSNWEIAGEEAACPWGAPVVVAPKSEPHFVVQ
jgi:hypothetical protein